MSNLDLLHKAFVDHFPARSEDDPARDHRASLEFVEVNERDGGYGVVVRLILWDVNPTTSVESIRDIKEQDVFLKLAGLDLASIGRMHELNAALVRVLAKALAHAEVETLMPHDLLDFTPLKLAKAKTTDDFVAALQAPSRLGRYLPNPA